MKKIILLALLVSFSFQGILFAQNSKVITVEKIEIPDKLRIRDRVVKKQYFGVIQNQKELKGLWSKLYDVYSDFNFIININKEPVPEIDFNKYSVLWYADRGSGASFVRSFEVVEYPDKLVAHVGLFHSDFGSNHLNLWMIPKTNKKVIFEENHEYEEGGP